MTKEQLNALEARITAIIREEDCASNIEDVVYRIRMREAVEIALRQPTQSDALQADIDAMKSILWVDTIIDDQEAIAKAFARHRQYGYDQGYYDGQRDRPPTQSDALRDQLLQECLVKLRDAQGKEAPKQYACNLIKRIERVLQGQSK